MKLRLAAVALAVAVVTTLAAACGGESNPAGSGNKNPEADTLQAVAASFDFTPGPPRRFLVGLRFGDGRLVGFGTIKVRVQPERQASGDYGDAEFLQVPGDPAPDPIPAEPQVVSAAQGRGVYAATVTLTEPGIWTADVEAEVKDHGKLTASTTFQVNTTSSAVAVGERAPASVNPTVDEHGKLPPSAIDSRADDDTPVPDPELHQTIIKDALAAKRPLVVVVSTPVFCKSEFCGPITDEIAEIAKEKSAQADFVHVEVWGNYAKQQFNAAAAEWIARSGNNANEPWVFVVGSDGIVKARFDNVVTRAELLAAIDEHAK